MIQTAEYKNRDSLILTPTIFRMLCANTILKPQRLVSYIPDYQILRPVSSSSKLFLPEDISPPETPYQQCIVAVMAGSSTGKNAILDILRNEVPDTKRVDVITATTRSRRKDRPGKPNEPESAHFFISLKEFKMIDRQGLLIEKIHQFNYWYGTPIEAVQRLFNQGNLLFYGKGIFLDTPL